MRVAIFTESAIGYVDNPEALYARGLAWGLVGRGHSVRMLEERRNPTMRRTLERVGQSASRHVYDAFPGVLIHSFEPRSGGRLMEWVARELSLVDLAVAIHGLPVELGRWIANLDHANLTRAFITYRPQALTPELIEELELARFDLRLAAGLSPENLGWSTIEPCLAPQDLERVAVEFLPEASTAKPEDVALALDDAVRRVRDAKGIRFSQLLQPDGSG